ncbi:hypothetical protein U1Q18_050530 [Sarracenia purpurea var. burkii]
MKRNIQRSEDTNNEFINLLSNAATSSVSDEDGTPIIHSTATANTSATAPTEEGGTANIEYVINSLINAATPPVSNENDIPIIQSTETTPTSATAPTEEAGTVDIEYINALGNTPLCIRKRIRELESEVQLLQKKVKKISFTEETFFADDKKLKYYTGLPSLDLFNFLLQFVKEVFADIVRDIEVLEKL